MRSHYHQLRSDRSRSETPPDPGAAIDLPPLKAAPAIDTPTKDSNGPCVAPFTGADAAPIAPSQRLPLIAHTLREARVGIAELRYEGRGGMGGFITEFHDRHRQKSLSHLIEEPITQQLTGFLWQLVLRRQPDWNDLAGSFGVVTWNLKTDLIRHVHHHRKVEVNTTVIEGL